MLNMAGGICSHSNTRPGTDIKLISSKILNSKMKLMPNSLNVCLL